MRHRSYLAFVMVLLLLATGCSSAVDPSYVKEVPRGIDKLEERKTLEIHVEAPDPACIAEENGVRFVSNEIVLAASRNVSKEQIEALCAPYGFRVVGVIESCNAFQLRSDAVCSLEMLDSACQAITAQDPEMCAIPNYYRNTVPLSLPSDDWNGDALDTQTAEGGNWGIEAINGLGFWENNPDLPSVRVGVIDTMFDVNHEDVVFAQMLHNDIYYETEKSLSVASHGTFTAGIIAASQDNGKGTAGLVKNCELIGSSLFGAPGCGTCFCDLSLLAELSAYGVEVISYNLGYSSEIVSALSLGTAKMKKMYDREVAFCTKALSTFLENGYDFILTCPAGNDSLDAAFSSMFAGITKAEVTKHILVIGAAEMIGDSAEIVEYSDGLSETVYYRPAPYSDNGARIDAYAPGTGIYAPSNRNAYTVISGTSAAAPHAAAECALVRALHPDFDCTQIKNHVVNSADILVQGSEKNMINLFGRVKISFEDVAWVPYDNVSVHSTNYMYTDPPVHVIRSGDSIEFVGYCVSKMDEGVTYKIQASDSFEIECDIDTSAIQIHPGGNLDISLGKITASLNQTGGSMLLNDNAVKTVGPRFHLKMSYSKGQYEIIVNGQSVGTLSEEPANDLEIKFGFKHDSHGCSIYSRARISDIKMLHYQTLRRGI